jgi:hypothetical protein
MNQRKSIYSPANFISIVLQLIISAIQTMPPAVNKSRMRRILITEMLLRKITDLFGRHSD